MAGAAPCTANRSVGKLCPLCVHRYPFLSLSLQKGDISMTCNFSPHRWIVLIGGLLLAAGCLQAQEIKVGALFDLTGITSDVGKSYAQGVRDAVEWTNTHGGVNGKRIRLIDVDYGYKIPE